MRNPLRSTGWVVRADSGQFRFVGTCFSLYRPEVLLTARHVLGTAAAGRISVSISLDRVDEGIRIERIVAHPTADLALMFLNKAVRVFDPFSDVGPDVTVGDDVVAFGYPENTSPDGPSPVPRMFKGHVQRPYSHTSFLGYQYAAAELSFGAPGGLSGGPVCRASSTSRAMGLVAENIESSTLLSSWTEVRDGNQQYKEEIRAVLNYAACVQLEPLRHWLQEHIRPGLMEHLR